MVFKKTVDDNPCFKRYLLFRCIKRCLIYSKQTIPSLKNYEKDGEDFQEAHLNVLNSVWQEGNCRWRYRWRPDSPQMEKTIISLISGTCLWRSGRLTLSLTVVSQNKQAPNSATLMELRKKNMPMPQSNLGQPSITCVKKMSLSGTARIWKDTKNGKGTWKEAAPKI